MECKANQLKYVYTSFILFTKKRVVLTAVQTFPPPDQMEMKGP